MSLDLLGNVVNVVIFIYCNHCYCTLIDMVWYCRAQDMVTRDSAGGYMGLFTTDVDVGIDRDSESALDSSKLLSTNERSL